MKKRIRILQVFIVLVGISSATVGIHGFSSILWMVKPEFYWSYVLSYLTFVFGGIAMFITGLCIKDLMPKVEGKVKR